MKPLASLILAFLVLTLTACVTDSAGNRRLDVVAVNRLAALAVDLASAHLGLPPDSARVIKTAAADLAGIAAQSQAHLGKSPAVANVSQGAGTPVIGAAVEAALPNRPITQTDVDAIFKAAEQTKNVK